MLLDVGNGIEKLLGSRSDVVVLESLGRAESDGSLLEGACLLGYGLYIELLIINFKLYGTMQCIDLSFVWDMLLRCCWQQE